MRIQEFERKTGLERPSIRFYEKEGLLNPKRLENGYREYSEEDVELLKKIKLLRQLGLSVEKISALQQGSEDLSDAIARQAAYHSSQIDDHKRCRAVCEAMRSDGAAFSTLDAEHYLTLLREIRIDDRDLGRTDFQEQIEKEIHPWRRFFARWLDYLLWGSIVDWLLFVLFRLRPLPGDFVNHLIGIASLASFIPVEAFLLSRFGTTPCKFALGIRVESIQGGKLSYSEALYRSLRVFTYGAGCGIHIVQLIAYLYHYLQLTGRGLRGFILEGPQDMAWDEESELTYSSGSVKRVLAAVLAVALSLGLMAVTILDMYKPKYRGSELTVAQVAANYNATQKVLGQEPEYYDTLQEDGTKKPVAQNTVVVDMNSSLGNHQMQFAYDTREEIVRSVSVHHEWDQVFYLSPLHGDTMTMACSLLLAQDGCGILELKEFLDLYEAHLNEKTASFTYKNLTVEWEITTQLPMENGILSAWDDETATAALDFKVTIHP